MQQQSILDLLKMRAKAHAPSLTNTMRKGELLLPVRDLVQMNLAEIRTNKMLSNPSPGSLHDTKMF
jgi:hypothetical protein